MTHTKKTFTRVIPLFLALMLCLASLSGCIIRTSIAPENDDSSKTSKNKEDTENAETDPLKAAVALLKEGKIKEAYLAFSALDSNQEAKSYLENILVLPTKEIKSTNNELEHTKEYFYNKKGQLLKKVDIEPNTKNNSDRISTYEYTYDASGKLIKETRTNTDSSDNVSELQYEETYNYDANGNLIKSELKALRYPGFYITETREYIYDSNGNCIQEDKYSSQNDSSKTRIVYRYDSNGNCIQEESYQYSDYDTRYTLSSTTTRVYNSAGKCVKETAETSSNEKTTEYTYNADGTLATIVRYNSDAPDERSEAAYRYSYDSDGNLIKETYSLTGSEYQISSEYSDYQYFYVGK